MDLRRDHCIENQKRERGSHLATAYGPVGLQWTTHASSERHQWGWWTPPWWCLDWICGFWNLRRLELIFVDSWGIYRAKRRCGRPLRWEQPTRARLGPHARPGGLCSPRGTPLVLLWPNRCLLVQKKSPKSFDVFGLHLVLIFCEVKNKQKTATGTGHYVNRLVQKNDIKLL